MDSSSAVKLYVDEQGSADVHVRVRNASAVFTSWLTYAEVRAALERKRRNRELSAAELHGTISDFEAEWATFNALEVSEIIIRNAADLAQDHNLSASDAIHLASAIALRNRGLTELTDFASADIRLNTAAIAEGFVVV